VEHKAIDGDDQSGPFGGHEALLGTEGGEKGDGPQQLRKIAPNEVGGAFDPLSPTPPPPICNIIKKNTKVIEQV
jgi:hypothetical protein